jgi:hypothetical protein
MTHGTCPRCDAEVTYAIVAPLEIKTPGGSSWHGLSYLCPACQCVLGVSLDQLSLKEDIADAVTKKLAKG